MSLSYVLILSSLLLTMMSENMVNSYNRHSRHHRQQVESNNCHNNQNYQNERRQMPKTVELESLEFWNCDFNLNDCGIRDEQDMDLKFVHRPANSEAVLGKTGLLYLDIAKCGSYGARLITPYFPTNGCRYACLTIEYLIYGNGIKNVYLIQQDDRNYCVWQKDNHHSNQWTNSSIAIHLTRSKPRFFLEVHFDRYLNNPGFIAISNMRFQYSSCHRNEANQCNLNRYIGTFI